MSTIRNVTERKSSENALRLTQFAVDGAQDSIFWMDRDARLTYVNDAVCTALGYSREQLLEMRVFDIDPVFPPDEWEKNWEGRFLERTIVFETYHRRADGRIFPVDVKSTYIRFEGEEVVCAFVRDISERRRSQEELQGHARQMEQKNVELSAALAAAREATELKSMFLANMSHEIRTPMNGVLGMLALTLDGELTAEQRDFLQTASDSAESMLALLEDILDLSRIEAGRLEIDAVPFRSRAVVEAAVEILSLRARQKGLGLTYEISPDVAASVIGDSKRLRQILVNLIGNAVKFTESGHVHVAVTQVAKSPDTCELHFSVTDTGIGIPADKRETVFEAFRQADGSITRRYGGTGLGLAICAKLVRLMNGRIWVEDGPGLGSAFHFSAAFGLPASESIGHETAETDKPPPQAPPRRFSVLLAEDNLVNQKLVSHLLTRQGHEIALAEDGHSAVFQAIRRRFDLILMDVQMPGLDGLGATRMIRALEQQTGDHVPIVALTANAMKGDRERCLEAGMDGYLSKPVMPAELARTIQAIVPHGVMLRH